MSEFLSIMVAPFVACLVLVGIHAYLGIHVLQRGIIFVDLALAQVAALGMAVAALLGLAPDGREAYLFALLFALGGAGVLTFSRPGRAPIPQEAVIGVVYATAAAAMVLVTAQAPHGAEAVQALLVGSILWVNWSEIGTMALLYGAVGWFHWSRRERFLALSFDPERAQREGWSWPFWDFLFYATFALVVTKSVQVAGVLLVFSFLVVPAMAGALLASRLRDRLLFGWGIGVAVSVVGITASYVWDLPTGAVVVCTFGLALLLIGLIARWKGITKGAY
ncbi:MAG: hypothetical protein KatS3mg115_1850 [Candidatus Poribacteria bacterium]|nr:MAG: hypothetical protein KatS3mg115_1850 [Candidatus Poribacteria bacterium]